MKFRREYLATALGLAGGVCTGAFNVIVLHYAQIPAQQLNMDFIYGVFFLLAFYGYLFVSNALEIKPILFGTTFFILVGLVGYVLVFELVPKQMYMPRFQALFPGKELLPVLAESSLNRLSWYFIIMLIAIAMAALRRLATKQNAEQ